MTREQLPELLAARKEIEAVLTKYDIAGHIILLGPGGHMEVLPAMAASWCVAAPDVVAGKPALRIRSRLSDYGGNKAKAGRDRASTAGAFHNLAETLAMHAMVTMSLSETIDEALGATHTPMERAKPPTEH